MWKTIRISILLFILAAVAFSTWRSKTQAVAWKYTLPVLIYPINADGGARTQAYIDQLDVSEFAAIEEFMQTQADSYGLQNQASIKISLRETLKELPPAPPTSTTEQVSAWDVMQWSLKFRWWAYQHAKIVGPDPQVRLFALHHEHGNVKIAIPESDKLPANYQGTTQELRFRLDTLDNLGAPTRGNFLNASMARSKCGLPNCGYQANFSFEGLTAFSSGSTATHFYAEWAKSQGDIAPLSLGGFLRLSGMETGSLSNKSIGFFRMVESKRIGSMPAALGGAIRVGYSLEIGGGFKANENIKFDKLKRGGSLFLSFDTRFGPLYTAWGKTSGGDSTFYLFLGPIW